jgi:hypothetical protein
MTPQTDNFVRFKRNGYHDPRPNVCAAPVLSLAPEFPSNIEVGSWVITSFEFRLGKPWSRLPTLLGFNFFILASGSFNSYLVLGRGRFQAQFL